MNRNTHSLFFKGSCLHIETSSQDSGSNSSEACRNRRSQYRLVSRTRHERLRQNHFRNNGKLLNVHVSMQVSGTGRIREPVVSNELEILVNASDNNARVRCEAVNSATVIPISREVVLRVNCKNFLFKWISYLKNKLYSKSFTIFFRRIFFCFCCTDSSASQGKNHPWPEGVPSWSSRTDNLRIEQQQPSGPDVLV